MTTPIPIMGLSKDHLLTEIRDGLKQALVEVRWFAANPYESLMDNTRDYTAWHHKGLHSPKKFVKWILPLWTTSHARKVAHEVFGRDESPVKELGEHPVTRYIRYLVFKRHLSYEKTTDIMISKLGWDKKSARPAVHRVVRSARDQNERIWQEELIKYPNLCEELRAITFK